MIKIILIVLILLIVFFLISKNTTGNQVYSPDIPSSISYSPEVSSFRSSPSSISRPGGRGGDGRPRGDGGRRWDGRHRDYYPSRRWNRDYYDYYPYYSGYDYYDYPYYSSYYPFFLPNYPSYNVIKNTDNTLKERGYDCFKDEDENYVPIKKNRNELYVLQTGDMNKPECEDLIISPVNQTYNVKVCDNQNKTEECQPFLKYL